MPRRHLTIRPSACTYLAVSHHVAYRAATTASTRARPPPDEKLAAQLQMQAQLLLHTCGRVRQTSKALVVLTAHSIRDVTRTKPLGSRSASALSHRSGSVQFP